MLSSHWYAKKRKFNIEAVKEMKTYKPGDRVIYRKPKRSSNPTPRAKDLHPAEHGEAYSYAVDKYWAVTRNLDKDRIEVMTRTGKLHEIQTDDPRLKKASILESLFYSNRFPHVSGEESAD